MTCQVIEQLVEHHLPALSSHLAELQMSMPFVTTHWFLCLFMTALPSESAYRCWDLLLTVDAAWLFRAYSRALPSSPPRAAYYMWQVGDWPADRTRGARFHERR
jgi:hypothetical protein